MPYIMGQWRGLLLILVMTIASAGVAALMPWPLKILVDYALGDADVPAILGSVLGALSLETTAVVLIVTASVVSLLLFALNSALDAGLNYAWSSYGLRMVYDLASDLFARLQRLSLLFHGQGKVGDWLARISGDTWCTYQLASDLLISPLQQVFIVFTVSAVALALDPLMTLYLLVLTPVLAVSARYFGDRLKKRARQQREMQSRIMSFVQQTLTAIQIVQLFGREKANRDHINELAAVAVKRSQQNVIVNQGFEFINGFLMATALAVIIFTGGQRVVSGAMTVGSLLVFVAYINTLKTAFGGLLGAYSNLKTTEASIDRVVEILDSEQKIEESPSARPLPDSTRPGASIDLDHVTFGYRSGHPVLHNVSIRVDPGERIALVGATGAGKSTLASLIPRLFDPWDGRILINGADARDVKIADLRNSVSLVLQDSFLLPMSVAANIAYARPGATENEVIAAAQAANAEEFIQKLPQGYDTILGERGATLSGGQRQRLSIARALLKDAPILILDEPTSALDTKTETEIIDALEQLMRGCTVIVIAHRFSTIRFVDRIYVLEDGRIVEQGNHSELMQAKRRYHRYFMLQAPGVEEGGKP